MIYDGTNVYDGFEKGEENKSINLALT